MTVTDQDARALAYLARRIRQETPGAPHWDQAGIDAVTKQLVGRGLAASIERVARHAADAKAQTPGAILRPFVPAAPTEGDRRPQPPKRGEACRVCGRHVDRCTCETPTTRPPEPSQHTTEHIESLRKQLRRGEEEA